MSQHQRQALQAEIVSEAKKWLGTPWRHNAQILGAGVDCVQLLIAVYSEVGLIPKVDTGMYPKDWHLNRSQPLFMLGLLRFTEPVDTPEVGDVVMFKFGRQAAHGAIHIGQDEIIHAWSDVRQVIVTNIKNHPLEKRIDGFYRVKGL